MNRISFSASTGGFYHLDIHGDRVPADAVPVSTARHRELLAAQAGGRTIVAGAGGRPVLAPLAHDGVKRARARAAGAVRREARRRTLAVATFERQVRDAADLACAALQVASTGSTSIDLAGPLDRRKRIDALRAAAAALALQVDQLGEAGVARLDVTDDQYWPPED